VIRYDDVLPLLLEACPSYAPSDEASRHDDRNGHYVNVWFFVSHLIRLLGEGRTEQFPLVFEVVDRVLGEGDHEARGLISNGFLRDLTSPEAFVGAPTGPRDFVLWLGPRALSDHNVQKIIQ
jgi:hypothetical protein